MKKRKPVPDAVKRLRYRREAPLRRERTRQHVDLIIQRMLADQDRWRQAEVESEALQAAIAAADGSSPPSLPAPPAQCEAASKPLRADPPSETQKTPPSSETLLAEAELGVERTFEELRQSVGLLRAVVRSFVRP